MCYPQHLSCRRCSINILQNKNTVLCLYILLSGSRFPNFCYNDSFCLHSLLLSNQNFPHRSFRHLDGSPLLEDPSAQPHTASTNSRCLVVIPPTFFPSPRFSNIISAPWLACLCVSEYCQNCFLHFQCSLPPESRSSSTAKLNMISTSSTPSKFLIEHVASPILLLPQHIIHILLQHVCQDVCCMFPNMFVMCCLWNSVSSLSMSPFMSKDIQKEIHYFAN